jgi:2-methylisocitrate lyase-like PEP mutase family enzyme
MPSSTAERRSAFRKLHDAGCFVLPNPWDVGSARMLQHLGFAAIASTSSGLAWSLGRPDNHITINDVLAHLTSLTSAVDLPLNADFESGFATSPEEVSHNVNLAINTGVAGLSIEDRDVNALDRLYETELAVERIRAARAAISKSCEDVILVARTESLLLNQESLKPTIDKLIAFAEAGADCLYAPGVRRNDDIATMVRAVAPKPLNVLVMEPGSSVQQLADLGVRRVSVGGSLARVAWGAAMAAMDQMRAGSFEGLAGGASSSKINQIFGNFIG